MNPKPGSQPMEAHDSAQVGPPPRSADFAPGSPALFAPLDEAAEKRIAERLLVIPRLGAELRHMLQKVIGQTSWRYGQPQREIEDLTQEVFRRLFERDKQGLPRLYLWRPDGGRSFKHYVSEYAKYLVRNESRRQRIARNSVALEAAEAVGSEYIHWDARTSLQQELERRELLERLRQHLVRLTGERGQRMFEHLFVQQLSTEDVASMENIKPNSVHQWRRRLAKLIAAWSGTRRQGSP